jgi:hypothetical protein
MNWTNGAAALRVQAYLAGDWPALVAPTCVGGTRAPVTAAQNPRAAATPGVPGAASNHVADRAPTRGAVRGWAAAGT